MTMNEIKAWDKEKVSRQQLNELDKLSFKIIGGSLIIKVTTKIYH